VIEGFVATGVLLLVLGLVGWGMGFAAAMMRTSLHIDTPRGSLHASASGLALGVLVAAGALYAYGVVLVRIGIVAL
jgi:hypothetical protein